MCERSVQVASQYCSNSSAFDRYAQTTSLQLAVCQLAKNKASQVPREHDVVHSLRCLVRPWELRNQLTIVNLRMPSSPGTPGGYKPIQTSRPCISFMHSSCQTSSCRMQLRNAKHNKNSHCDCASISLSNMQPGFELAHLSGAY